MDILGNQTLNDIVIIRCPQAGLKRGILTGVGYTVVTVNALYWEKK